MRQPTWPVAIIDFEASGLGVGTYPIEVGVCIWRSPDELATTWSTLIRPAPEWVRDGDWHERAQNIHGISPVDLVDGMDPADVMRCLNDLLDPIGVVHCDGGKHDMHWMTALRMAANVPALFVLGRVSAVIQRSTPDQWEAYEAWMKANPGPHRAGPDAEGIVSALATAAGIGVPSFRRTGPHENGDAVL